MFNVDIFWNLCQQSSVRKSFDFQESGEWDVKHPNFTNKILSNVYVNIIRAHSIEIELKALP